MSKVRSSDATDTYHPSLAHTRAYLAGSTSSNTTATILVIEDDAGVRRLTRRTLEGAGYRVMEAEDGEEGLRLVEQHADAIDLVLTDIEMPRLDGISVARSLALLHPGIGVVCMSGRMPDTAFQKQLGDPRPPFLAKPFSFEDLARATSETLARVRGLSY